MADAPVAASSAAVETAPVDPVAVIASLTAEQRQAWELTGTLPDPEPTPTPAESAPAQPVEQAASTDATPQPASEPGTPPKSNAETRIKELLAERHQLREELAAARAAKETPPPTPDVQPAESSPAPAQAFPSFDAWSEQHPTGTYEQYSRELVRHELQIERAQERERQVAEQRTRDVQTRAKAFAERRHAAIAADPAFLSKLSPDVSQLRPVDGLQPGEPMTALNVVAQEILESALAPKLMLHLSEHPEDLAALASLSPPAVIRRMAKLEAQLEAATPPAPKLVSSAPPPPPTLGSKPAEPADEVQAAVSRGDFSAFESAMNRRELARR